MVIRQQALDVAFHDLPHSLHGVHDFRTREAKDVALQTGGNFFVAFGVLLDLVRGRAVVGRAVGFQDEDAIARGQG